MATAQIDSCRTVAKVNTEVQQIKDSLQKVVSMSPLDALNQITSVKKNIVKLIENTENSIKTLVERSAIIQKNLQSLSQQVTTKSQEKANIETALNNEKAELASCQSKLASLNNEVHNLNNEISRLQEQIRKERRKRRKWYKDPVRAVVSHLNGDEERYKSRKNGKTHERDQVQNQVNALNHNINQSQVKLQTQQTSITSLQQQIKNTELEIKDLGVEVTKLKTAVSELRNIVVSQRLLGNDVNVIKGLIQSGVHQSVIIELIEDLTRVQGKITN